MNPQDYITEKSALNHVSDWTLLSVQKSPIAISLKIDNETYQFRRIFEFKEGLLLASTNIFDVKKWVIRLADSDTDKYRINGNDYKYTGLVAMRTNVFYYIFFERIDDAEILPKTAVFLSR